jgi:flavin-dependent dehydrogenase
MNIDTVIIGGGPAGTSTAIALNNKGISNIIIEKETFPRFHIGESMTGECGASVRALGLEHRMREYGHCIKIGTKVFGSGGGNAFYIPVMGRDEAGELYVQKTWQVRRSEFDDMLMSEAKEHGTQVLDARAMSVLRNEGGDVCGVVVRYDDGSTEEIRASVVVDASGQSTFLSTAGVASPKQRGKYSKQAAFYSHFKGAIRNEEEGADDTLIFYQKKNYWAWFIPIDSEIVSIGVVTPTDYFKNTKEDRETFLRREMKELNSELARRVMDVEMVDDVRGMSNYSYHVKEFTGRGYICVGDSHRFIDPIFSFGMHFALAEAIKASDAIEQYIKGETANLENPFIEYQQECERGQDVVMNMLDAFWDYPLAFSLYVKSKQHQEDFIDMFAGRVYREEPYEGLQVLQKLNDEGRLGQSRSIA